MPLAIFSNVGIWEILIILAVLMLLFGSKRLPSMGRSLGRGMREFKDSVGATGRELKQAIEDTPDQVRDAYEGEPRQSESRPALPPAGPESPETPVASVATPVPHQPAASQPPAGEQARTS